MYIVSITQRDEKRTNSLHPYFGVWGKFYYNNITRWVRQIYRRLMNLWIISNGNTLILKIRCLRRVQILKSKLHYQGNWLLHRNNWCIYFLSTISSIKCNKCCCWGFRNRGKELNNLFEFIKYNRSIINIYSNNGIFWTTKDRTASFNNNIRDFKGTIVGEFIAISCWGVYSNSNVLWGLIKDRK